MAVRRVAQFVVDGGLTGGSESVGAGLEGLAPSPTSCLPFLLPDP